MKIMEKFKIDDQFINTFNGRIGRICSIVDNVYTLSYTPRLAATVDGIKAKSAQDELTFEKLELLVKKGCLQRYNEPNSKLKILSYEDIEKALTLLYMLGDDPELAEVDTVEDFIEVLANNRTKEVDIS